MCGICGYLPFDARERPPREVVDAMTAALSHRGPDASGVLVRSGVGLGHARLSIIDLRAEANQPMLSDDGEVALVYNGECYNFVELRRELESLGHGFRTDCDTEVVLRAYEQWGLDFLARLRGMFALGLWDGRQRKLILARDRIGQKPLFFFADDRALRFSSELRSLLQDPTIPRQVDGEALHLYLSLGFVPGSHGILQGLQKVEPGGYVVVQDGKVERGRYWRLRYDPQPLAPFGRARARQREELEGQLRQELEDAVRMRMVADVPLGAFLSGGLDSSLVVGLMAQYSSRPVKTFSIGFEDRDYSEVQYARMVAKRWNTEHHEEIMRPDAAALLPKLVAQYGEPFADPSSVPTYLLSQMTRRHVTVALSGDAGDEVFAGYTRYAHERLAQLVQSLPTALTKPLLSALERHAPGTRRGLIGEIGAGVREMAVRLQMPDGPRYQRQFNLFPTEMAHEVYSPGQAAEARLDAETLFAQLLAEGQVQSELEKLLYIDCHTYLPNDILVKVDIASMAHSLEVRSPLLDHRVVELAARIPSEEKLSGLRGKQILRRVSKGVVPKPIIHRRKKGFGIPHARWLRGDLRDLAHDTLNSPRARQRGRFKAGAVERMLEQHDKGLVNHGLRIWALLWLELWYREFIDGVAVERAA
jgi:asparagine synthase (glutamine-hydrolysing)